MKGIKVLILALSLCSVTSIFAAAADNVSKEDTQIYHVDQGINLISTLKFQYDKPRIVVKSIFPQLETDGSDEAGVNAFNQLINDYVQQAVDEFRTNVMRNQAQQQQLAKSKIKNNFYIDYDTSFVKSGSETIASVRFTYQGYISGQGRPFHFHRVLNYALNANQKIGLNDLFLPGANYLSVISNYVYNKLAPHFPDKDRLANGTAAKLENYQNWNIKPQGLLITFEESQISPYVNGTQTILIPYSVLNEMLSPISPLNQCIKSHKKCVRNNLLTGGFIEEAINSKHSILNPILS